MNDDMVRLVEEVFKWRLTQLVGDGNMKYASAVKVSSAGEISYLINRPGESPIELDGPRISLRNEISDVKHMLRDKIFEPLNKYLRYKRIRHRDVKHARGCSSGVYFDCINLDDLGANTFTVVDAAVSSMVESGTPEDAIDAIPRLHWAYCTKCGARVHRASLLIRVSVSDQVFSREYSLE
jgi:hypothetical protein